MAVTQISRIQHRRGLEQDLPQLSSAELGWSVDTRKLYIGNGTLEEGAPTVGVTRILTEYDVSTLQSAASNTYTFVGNSAGFTSQTGPSTLSPIVRTLQGKLDDTVNVRDFGAVGNGITDDTAAINRALQQIYLTGSSETNPRARRTLYFPGGTYLLTTPLYVPPYARLVGDGMGSSIIKQSVAGQSAVILCDSKFQTDVNLGSGSATMPKDVDINGLQFINSSTTASASIFVIDSANNIRIQGSRFTTSIVPGNTPILVEIDTTVDTSNRITFDGCEFTEAGTGISITGTGCTAIRVFNSLFDNISGVSVNLGNTIGYTSIGNYYGTVGNDILANGNNFNFSLGDSYETLNALQSGLLLGNLFHSGSQQYTLTTTPLVLTFISNTAPTFQYEIRSSANARAGTFSVVTIGSSSLFDDSYVETASGVNANLFANATSLLASVSSGTATFKFNFSQFI
jgi:hypothetical protein